MSSRRSSRCSCGNTRRAHASRIGSIVNTAAVATIAAVAATTNTSTIAVVAAIVAATVVITTLVATTVATALVTPISTLPVFARREVGVVSQSVATLATRRALALVGRRSGFRSRQSLPTRQHESHGEDVH
jgi:hypothetical protein